MSLAPGVSARILATAVVRVPTAEFPHLREALALEFREVLSTSLLKQCDDQTQVALSAVRAAGGRSIGTSDWGVVACPRNMGRRRYIDMVTKFRTAGAWSATPHYIPHCLLHSMAGLLSQAFGLHGPNAGVGGTPGSEVDALRTAGAWLAGGDLPGAWLVRAGWEPETGTFVDSTCTAIAAAVERCDGPGQPDAWSVIAAHAEGQR